MTERLQRLTVLVACVFLFLLALAGLAAPHYVLSQRAYIQSLEQTNLALQQRLAQTQQEAQRIIAQLQQQGAKAP